MCTNIYNINIYIYIYIYIYIHIYKCALRSCDSLWLGVAMPGFSHPGESFFQVAQKPQLPKPLLREPQQALQKLEKFPALLCENATPAFDEWAHYIRVDLMGESLV